ncbi:MAG: helix-turn-helix domain-containing protein [Acidimicrobiales bacterium]
MAHPVLDAIQPLVDAIGAKLIEPDELQPGDVELMWEGKVAGGVRLPDVPRDIDWYLASVEREVGGPLAELSREDKQRAVKLLNDRGAFQLRKSVEQVAEVLGVSRFTVYNYLNRPESTG